MRRALVSLQDVGSVAHVRPRLQPGARMCAQLLAQLASPLHEIVRGGSTCK